jgi:hypothetical protein
MRTLTGRPLFGSMPSSRACTASARETVASLSSDLFPEGSQKPLHDRDPLLLAAGDLVELVLQPRGEVVVHVLREVLGEEGVDDAADVRGHEAPAVHLHVLAVLQRGDDAGVGGGPSDAVLLQGLDQARLGVARRRLGEVLLGAHVLER